MCGIGAPGVVTDERCKMYGTELRSMISPTRLAGEDQNESKIEENEGNVVALEQAAGRAEMSKEIDDKEID